MNRPMPSDATRSELLAAIAATPSRSRREQARLRAIMRSGAVLVLGLALAALPPRQGERVTASMVVLALAWGIGAAICVHAVARGPMMVGRPARHVVGAVAAAAALPLVVTTIVGLGSHSTGFARSAPCLVTTLAIGVVPTAALAWERVSAGGALVGRTVVGAAIAVGSALAAGMVVLLHCPDASLGHLLRGHLSVIATAGVVGALGLGRLLRPSRPRVR